MVEKRNIEIATEGEKIVEEKREIELKEREERKRYMRWK